MQEEISNTTNKTNFYPIQVYIYCLSEPSQLIHFFFKQSGLKYQIVDIDLAKQENRKPEYLKINPFHQVPAIHDPNTDLTISQSHTIIRYITEQYYIYNNWYPKNLIQRTKIDMYLDWHHTNTRQIANYHFVKVIAPWKKIPSPYKEQETLDQIKVIIGKINDIWLKNQKYIASEEQPSVADYAAFLELETLGHMEFDFQPYLNIINWQKKISQTPEIIELQEIAKIYLKQFENN